MTLEDGSIVHPFQVMENPLPSQAMIFMFMPTDQYLDGLLEKMEEFEAYYPANLDNQKTEMHLIYHSIPLKVLLNERYKEFMLRFGGNVRHIIDCHETNEEVIARFKSQQLTQRHSKVCPSLIPLSPVALRNYELETSEQLKSWLSDIQYFNSRVGLAYNIFPNKDQGVDYS